MTVDVSRSGLPMASGQQNIDSTRKKLAAAAIDAMVEHGFVETSESDRKPKSISKGHPVYRAVLALEETYPDKRLPALARPLWRNLLNLSRKRNPSSFTAADQLIAWLEKVAKEGPAAPDVERENGPYEPYLFWWDNKGYPLSRRLWRLAKFLWWKEFAKIEDAIDEVWDGREVLDSAIKSASSRLNLRLSEIGVTRELSLENGYFKWLEIEDHRSRQ